MRDISRLHKIGLVRPNGRAYMTARSKVQVQRGVIPRRQRVKEWEQRRCNCGGVVKGILLDGVIYSCNTRRCDKCKKKYYSTGYLKLKFIESFRLTDFKEYADLF